MVDGQDPRLFGVTLLNLSSGACCSLRTWRLGEMDESGLLWLCESDEIVKEH